MPKSKGQAGFLIILCYFSALCASLGVGWHFSDWHPIFVILFADIAGTFVVWGFSFLYRNSSFYDPYWSVAPVVICLYLLWLAPLDNRSLVVSGLVAFWGIRLTYNWWRTWQGLHHEDWRYSDLRNRWGRKYPLIDLAGIHLFPTLQVFLGCLALYPAFTSGTSITYLDGIAAAVTITAIAIEMIADAQLHQFKSTREPGQVLTSGLWAISRHPNYMGEILFWWGLALFGFSAVSEWWVYSGALAITLMFYFISVPLIERRHLAKRPTYQSQINSIPMIFPSIFSLRQRS